MNAAKKTSKHSWIAPVVAIVLAVFCLGLMASFDYEFQADHEWTALLPLVGSVLLLYAAGKFIWMAIVSQKGGPVLVAVGVGLMLACWFLFDSLPGLIVGAVLTLVGAGLLIKQRSQP